MNATNRIAFNTGILYFRMFLTIGITLYTTRLVLSTLGDVDYGILNLIGGIILMLSFLNNAMATATQRFLSFFQGKKDILMQKKVFKNSLIIHFLIAVFLVILLEFIRIFIFSGVLNIPANRLNAAGIVYHFMSGTVFFTVLSVPFNGSLIAHENMLWVAIVNIFESLLKLGAALFLFQLEGDKLIYYSFLTALISIVTFLLYAVFCFSKYEECKINLPITIDKPMAKDLTSFAGWNLFGALCGLGKTQGLAILLNVFFGTLVNAAYGISNQVSGQLNFFSGTTLRAINPQILKSEGDNDRERVIKLSLIASKFGFLLLAIFAIPCIFEMPAILNFWLKKTPAYAVPFCSLLLVAFMVNQMTVGLDSAAQATGKIKKYMLLVGSTKLLIIPTAYILLKFKFSIYHVFHCYIVLEGLGGLCRIYILKTLVGLSVKEYLNKVVFPLILPLTIIISLDYTIISLSDSKYRVLFLLPISFFAMAICVYFFGLVEYEKNIIHTLFSNITKKLRESKHGI